MPVGGSVVKMPHNKRSIVSHEGEVLVKRTCEQWYGSFAGVGIVVENASVSFGLVPDAG